MYHLQSDEPLFRRAIVMSGSSFIARPLPLEAHEQNYERAIAALGLAESTPEERIKALLQMPGPEVVEKLPPPVLVTAPALDGDIIRSAMAYAEAADAAAAGSGARAVCKDLLIGDAQIDVSCLSSCFSGLVSLLRSRC